MTKDQHQCKWFALCTRPAEGRIAHPILGSVAACRRCAEFVGRDFEPMTTLTSRELEANPEQLVGHRAKLASKEGGGWVGTVTGYANHRYTLADGEFVPSAGDRRPFKSDWTFLHDVARAAIIETSDQTP